ncbi:MAG TPA: hypothetical protein VGB31_02890 [Myxococcota bacterium]
MNGWDLFTWFNCVVLAGDAIIIFGFFLRDAKGILAGQQSDVDGVPTETPADADPGSLLEVPGPIQSLQDRS